MSREIIASPVFEMSSRARSSFFVMPRRDKRKLKSGMRSFLGNTLHSVLASFSRNARREVLCGRLIVHQFEEFFVLLRMNGSVLRILDILKYEGHVLAEFIKVVVAIESYFETKSAGEFERRVVLVDTVGTIELRIVTRLGNKSRDVVVGRHRKPRDVSRNQWWVGLNSAPATPGGQI